MTKEELIRQIKISINHYFETDPWTGECNDFFDPCKSASEVIDDIVDLISMNEEDHVECQ